MADAPKFDPRFNPAFQPGYSGPRSVPQGPGSATDEQSRFRRPGSLAESQQLRGKLPSQPGQTRPRAAEPQHAHQSPDLSSRFDHDGPSEEVTFDGDEPSGGETLDDAAETDEDDTPAIRNPFEIALWVLSAVLIGGGVAITLWATSQNGSYYFDSAETPWPLILAQLAWTVTQPMVMVGMATAVGTLFWRALVWKPTP